MAAREVAFFGGAVQRGFAVGGETVGVDTEGQQDAHEGSMTCGCEKNKTKKQCGWLGRGWVNLKPSRDEGMCGQLMLLRASQRLTALIA
jgi:hypothetical protein